MRKGTTGSAKRAAGKLLLRTNRWIAKRGRRREQGARRHSRGRCIAVWPDPQPQGVAAAGVVCGFGATCVGVLLERLRLHLRTQRFLAARRGDRMWEASCDYAALSLERLGARLRPGMFEQPLFPAEKAARRGVQRKCRASRGGR
jgi:HAMP domain-containing protein